MEILRARELGLCFGVRRAVNMVRDGVRIHGTLRTLGPLAHNPMLLKELESLGVISIDSLDEATGPAVVISAHGVGPDIQAALLRRSCAIIDTTCPNVARAQRIAAEMAAEALTIVIFGDADHTEVRGLLGWAGDHGIATLNANVLNTRDKTMWGQGIGVISQTTQRLEDYALFAQRVIAIRLSAASEVRVVNTLCTATRRRQDAAIELSNKVDAMIVIGSKTSANTRRLAETCRGIVHTWHVETADEVPMDLLRDKRRIGITAGASTPDCSIEQVEARLRLA